MLRIKNKKSLVFQCCNCKNIYFLISSLRIQGKKFLRQIHRHVFTDGNKRKKLFEIIREEIGSKTSLHLRLSKHNHISYSITSLVVMQRDGDSIGCFGISVALYEMILIVFKEKKRETRAPDSEQFSEAVVISKGK